MNRIPGRGWWPVAAAVSLMFAVLLFGAPTPSAAATYTFHFAGAAVSGSPDDDTVFHTLGIVAGDPVSGTMTLDPFITDPTTVNASSSVFQQPSTSFTFHVGHPGKPGKTFTVSGTGEVASGGGLGAIRRQCVVSCNYAS